MSNFINFFDDKLSLFANVHHFKSKNIAWLKLSHDCWALNLEFNARHSSMSKSFHAIASADSQNKTASAWHPVIMSVHRFSSALSPNPLHHNLLRGFLYWLGRIVQTMRVFYTTKIFTIVEQFTRVKTRKYLGYGYGHTPLDSRTPPFGYKHTHFRTRRYRDKLTVLAAS
jgi:hypothetical protein